MKKNYNIVIRVSAEEKKTLQDKSRKVGLKVGQYLRFLGLRANIREIGK